MNRKHLEGQGVVWQLDTIYPSLDSEEVLEDLEAMKRLNGELDHLKADFERLSPEGPWSELGVVVCRIWSACREVLNRLKEIEFYDQALGGRDRRHICGSHPKVEEAGGLASRALHLKELIETYLADLDEDRFATVLEEVDSEVDRAWFRRIRKARHGQERRLNCMGGPPPGSGFAFFGGMGAGALDRLVYETQGAEGQAVPLTRSDLSELATSPREEERRAAFEIREAAYLREVSALHFGVSGQVQNALEDARAYGSDRCIGPLARALAQSALSPPSFQAMMTVVMERREIARQRFLELARLEGQSVARPWNRGHRWFSNACPRRHDLDAALKLVRAAFGEIHPELAIFVDHARSGNWMDVDSGEFRRKGAWCGYSPRLGEPRIYVGDFDGRAESLRIIGHELGHAYRIRSLGAMAGMDEARSLAFSETVAIFFEEAVLDHLAKTTSGQERDEVATFRTMSFVAMTLDVAHWIDLELSIFEQTRKHFNLSPELLFDTAAELSQRWYGQAMEPHDPFSWIILVDRNSRSFYSFTYLFGYLVAQALHRERRKRGTAFFDRFQSLCTMTATRSLEHAFRECFDFDLTSREFWEASYLEAERSSAFQES